ncbi:MAG: zinc ribbon domain-containing protein [Pyrinomonadaceae bacterium]
MFCPNCSASVNKKLKYCSSCGERLSKSSEIDKDGMPGKMLDNVLTTVFLVVMFGLGILVGLVAVLMGSGMPMQPVVVIIVAYLAAVFGICIMLLKQVPKLIDARLRADGYAEESREAGRLAPLTTAQLEEYREPVMSVTDRTTKTLDKVPLERN